MGIYLNPGKGKFEEAVNSAIYVDKSGMIAYLNTVVKTEQKYVSVSRPRRFGKSIAANMLAAYYGKGDSGDLFRGLNVSSKENWNQYLNHFDVISITNILKHR